MTIGATQTGSAYWPSQVGVILANESITWLSKELVEKDNIKFFMPGRVTNDAIENFFSSLRQFNSNPTCLQCQRFSKAICISQFLKYSPNGNYDEDDSTLLLDDMLNLKKVQDKEDEEPNEDHEKLLAWCELFDKYDLDSNDFAENCSLANIAGYMLSKTISSKSKCTACVAALISDGSSEDQECNALITNKEHTHLVRPTKLGNSMFKCGELVFRKYREAYKGSNNMHKKLLGFTIKDLKEEFPDAPVCHLETIFGRFLRARCIFWARFTNEYLQIQQADVIIGEANASKSTKTKQILG